MDRETLRGHLRQQRDQLTLPMRIEMDDIILYNVKYLLEPYKTIATYVSFGSEVDTILLISELLYSHRIVVPKVWGQGKMTFHEITSLDDLEPNQMGILEPKQGTAIDSSEIDAFIIPMLGFNERKYRIGYGGGYYDRYLEKSVALKIGVSYSMQETQHFVEAAHDIPCDIIVSELEVIS